MGALQMRWGSVLLVLGVMLVMMPGRAAAFGAGNIPSIAQVEGHNWRHGDIEDMLKTIAFLKGKKWTTLMVQRVYFGNWLRDYSQAVDIGSLKGVNAATIRILVWVLSFLAHGYATEEFEVTEERLGVYRPEEHIDNPLGYGDGLDARKFDPRLRGPVDPREVEIDPRTGMKNYIANESGGWATSAGYLRFSFARSIHFGRVYLHGSGGSGKETDLCEALRCLGQALHCMEDFSAHSNYCELALRELGHHDVFPHCGASTEINLNGRRVFPLVTGTFGAVDFLHSVIGEATDHFTQSEVDEMNSALQNAESITKPTAQNIGLSRGAEGGEGSRGLFGLSLSGLTGSSSSSSGSGGGDFVSLLGKIPGVGGGFASEASSLQAASKAQEQENAHRASANQVPGMSPDFDPVKTASKIYPILQFRDKIVRSINNTISKVPGLESLLEKIGETLTAFIMGLLAPFIRPIINQVSKTLKDGSSGVISASANSQLEPWKDPSCSNPTHSMLSKDHFTNVLNSCAGRIASTLLQYVVPRVLYAWENPGVPVDEVVNDVLRAFHHPAARNDHIEIQRQMFDTVKSWLNESSHRHEISRLLSSEAVKTGKNHILPAGQRSGPGGAEGVPHSCNGGHGRPSTSLWSQIKTRDMNAMGAGGGAPQPSPAPYQSHQPPSSPGYGYTQGGAAGGGGQAQSYYSQAQGPGSGYGSAPPPQPSYGQHPQHPQQYPPQGQQPPPGQPAYWGQPPPHQQGYGSQQQQPPYQQPQQPTYAQPPPPNQYGGGGWNQYPGQRY